MGRALPPPPPVEMQEMEADAAEVTPPSPRPVTRCTRSQVAREWTAQEMLTLASVVSAVEEDCRRALSSYQRWVIVADNCSAILGGAPRSANQCRRQWDAMLADHRRIQAWEEKEEVSYWSLDGEGRRAARLPVDFDREVAGAIARSVREQGRCAVAGDVVSESEEQDHHPGKGDDEDAVLGKEVSGCKKTMQTETSKTAERMDGLACKLQESAQHVLAIVRGELSKDDAGKKPPLVDLKKPSSIYIEFKRRQADELIKALGSLIGSIDHFTELAEEHGRDGV